MVTPENIAEVIRRTAEYGVPVRSIEFKENSFVLHVGFDPVAWARLELSRRLDGKKIRGLNAEESALLRKCLENLTPDIEEREY